MISDDEVEVELSFFFALAEVLSMKVKLAIFCALAAAAKLLQPAYVPPASCTYAEKKLGCVPNRIPMASTYGPFDLVPDVLVPCRCCSSSAAPLLLRPRHG